MKHGSNLTSVIMGIQPNQNYNKTVIYVYNSVEYNMGFFYYTEKFFNKM